MIEDNLFTLYPAIDIKDGKCVRLLFGDMEKDTIYNNNPLDQAMWFIDQGAEWLHIVDLDGAISGKSENKKIIKNILKKLKDKVKIQIGGGIRNIFDIDFWLQNSVNRVILGTLAIILRARDAVGNQFEKSVMLYDVLRCFMMFSLLEYLHLV